MEDFNIFGPSKKIGNKKQQGILGGNLNFDFPKKQKNSFNMGINLEPPSKKVKYERIPVTSEQKRAVLFRQKDKCAWANCRVHFHRDGVPPHFDHKKRVDKGGKSLIDNIQALCPNHHQLKTHKENLKEVEKNRQKSKIKEDNTLFGGGRFF